MKMMRTIALMIAVMAFGASAWAKMVNLDPAENQIRWVGKKVSGQHNGTIKMKSGKIDINKNDIKGGEIVIDMTSIVVEDLKDPEYNGKLTGHLKSDDFFGVDKHPTSTFKIKSVKPLKNSKDGSHEISGDLTIKGKTFPLSFPAQVEIKDGVATAKGKARIERTQYGIRYGSGKFFENLGDKMIDDHFEVEFDLKAKI